uniref:Rab proteins geranylgeranyltransferase component n=1 Tax=Spongospora subterranea TaxID=70186 RepID=A0A0H5QGN3_9EUKA|eukprot:CRZ00762.1 hypothetical protein [Spongospora subterranea]
MIEEGPTTHCHDILDQDRFDAVIVGTGLWQSMLAAGLSIAGKSVLHCDPNEYYGGECATLPWAQFYKSLLDKGAIYSSYGEDPGQQFLFDLQPKVIFSTSNLVDDIVKSKSFHYLSFQCINNYYTVLDGAVTAVPISKADIFQCGFLDRSEKRRFMKLMHIALGDDTHSQAPSNSYDNELRQRFRDLPFALYLEELQLSKALQDIVLYSLCFADSAELKTADGILLVRKFIKSLGKFDSGALLYPVYGTGDIPQAFCRLSAVNGGIYLLRSDVTAKCPKTVILSESQQAIECDIFVDGSIELPDSSGIKSSGVLSRCICITTAPSKNTSSVSLIMMPPMLRKHSVRVLQLDETTGCAPKGCYILYLSSIQEENPESDLRAALDLLVVEEHRQKTLFYSESLHSNLIQVPEVLTSTIESGFSMDMDHKAEIARALFSRYCPGSHFLQKSPDQLPDVDLRNNPEFNEITVDADNSFDNDHCSEPYPE